MHVSESTHCMLICDLNFTMETEIFPGDVSHVHCKCGNISEMMLEGHVVITGH